jgi:hypothetical protein
VIVDDFCEPIFSRSEMDELLRVAAEIEGTPPRGVVSPHLLSGLVECNCGTKMYGIHSYVTSKRGRYRVGYYRCRRASHKGTCAAKQIPAPVVERIVIDELRRLALDPERVAALAGDAQHTYQATVKRLIARRAEASAELKRIAGRLGSLLELAEDRLVTKQEYAARRSGLEAERAARRWSSGSRTATTSGTSSSSPRSFSGCSHRAAARSAGSSSRSAPSAASSIPTSPTPS